MRFCCNMRKPSSETGLAHAVTSKYRNWSPGRRLCPVLEALLEIGLIIEDWANVVPVEAAFSKQQR